MVSNGIIIINIEIIINIYYIYTYSELVFFQI